MTNEPDHLAADVTVIIPTIGRPTLRDCLAHVQMGTRIPSEVIIVHQGNDTATRETCDEFNADGFACRYLSFPKERGAASARNRGIERCTTRFLATIDDDCLADLRWLETLVRRLNQHPGSVITGQTLTTGRGEGHVPSLIDSPDPQVYLAPTQRRDVLYTGCMGSPVEVFERVGLFNEARALLPAAEDNEWAYRVLTSGVPIRYEPEARVTHLDWRSAAQASDVIRRYARGQGGFYGLYLRRFDGFVARRAVRDLARGAHRSLVALGRRDRSSARSELIRVVELARGILAGLTERTPAPRPGWLAPHGRA